MPTLSVCIPTFERPALLERALASVTSESAEVARDVQIVVCDNSRDEHSAQVCDRMFAAWPSEARRFANRPSIGMVANFNRCIALATGEYIVMLHDDDYFIPGGIAAILKAVARARHAHQVLLFGVDVVDGTGRLRRRQSFRGERYLPPSEALEHLLSNSSYVRFPAIVIAADAYRAAGPFDVNLDGATDLDMWIRLFAHHGVDCQPQSVCAYSVHSEAHTAGMFKSDTIATLVMIFDRVVERRFLAEDIVRRCERDFLAQFILGGAYRQLRAGDRTRAREIMALSELPSVRAIGNSRRWSPVRMAMSALVRAPVPLISRAAQWIDRVYAHISFLWPR